MPPSGNFTPASVRDKLNINSEDGLEAGETPAAHKIYRTTQKEQLKMGLSGLPAPKNDYEIVVPEHETENDGDEANQAEHLTVEDQADVDARKAEELRIQAEKEMALRSKVSFVVFKNDRFRH